MDKKLFHIFIFLICLASANLLEAQTKVIKGQYLISGGIGISSGQNYRLYKNHESEFSGLAIEQPVDLDPNDKTCENLIASGQATFCEPNYYVEASLASNDPLSSTMYALSQIQAYTAWDKSVGSSSVVVAVIDTGIDYGHPDLAQNVWVNPGEVPSNGIDDDGNGWVDDIHGINALTGSGNPYDDNGHGTHVAGTIGARGNNSIGVTGVNWDVRIIGLKFLNANGGGSIFGAIKAIDYMIDLKNRYGINLKISNNSWGGPGYSQSLYEAIARAEKAGIVFIAAAGNEGNNNDYVPAYPANYNLANVVSVAAVDQSRQLTFFSNFGQNVDLAAPGMSILSTIPGGGYGSLSGTSMAAPHVAGALALLSSTNPALNAADLITQLKQTVSVESSLIGKIATSGLLNLAALLGQSVPADNSLKIKRMSVTNSKKSKYLRDGDRLNIAVSAEGFSSQLPMQISVNNKVCDSSKVLTVVGGKNKFRAKVSGVNNAVKKITFSLGEKKASSRLIVSSSEASRRSKLSSRSLATTCSRLIRSIK